MLLEAKGVPLFFCAVMSTGFVIIEEVTDALQSLNWHNAYADTVSLANCIHNDDADNAIDDDDDGDVEDGDDDEGEEEGE